MPLPSYQVNLLHPATGNVIGILDGTSFYQLRYSRVMNGVGALAITLPANRFNESDLPLDLLIEPMRTHPVTGQLQVEETYLARIFQRYRDENEEQIVIGAVSLNHLLGRRIVDPADDPLEAGGFSTKQGAADAVLAEYASQQCGPGASVPRQFPGLSIASVLGIAPSIGLRLRYENLIEIFQEQCLEADIQFQIVRTGGTSLQLQIGKLGMDRTQTTNFPSRPFVLLNPIRGNLSNPRLVRDRRDEQNFVYLQGKGQGGNRTLLTYFSSAISDSPYNRIEFKEDAREVEKGDSLGLLTQAANAVKEKRGSVEFDFKPLGTEPGNTYRLDWNLADKITATYNDYTVNVRITEVAFNVSSAGEDLTVTTENI